MSNVTGRICTSGLVSLQLYHIIPRYILLLTGMFSNIFLLVGMIMDPLKCFRNSSSYLIMNLAVMDLLTCSSNILFLHWRPCVKGHEIHTFFNFPPYIAIISIFTMACDRYMSCVHPFKYRVLITRRVALTVLLLQSSFCAGYMVFEAFLVNVALYSRCSLAVLILFSAAILYARSGYILKANSRYLKNSTAIRSSVNSQGRIIQSARLVNEKRLLATMLLVSSITVVTLGPPTVYESLTGTIHYVNEFSRKQTDFYHVWLTTLLLVNFSINPVIYVWRLRNFRETFSTLVTRACHLLGHER
jgi:hypothetical protein